MPVTGPPAARFTGAGRRSSLALWLWPAAAVAMLTGCVVGECRDGISELAVHFRACKAADQAFLHRGDLFHQCCSSPLDFKQGFKDGYVEVALNGDDVCASPTPPSRYWGCTTNDPCQRTELLNCYYDGWAHGAIAAAQDGVVAMNTVPIRNLCGGQGGPPQALGPGRTGPSPFGPYGPNSPGTAPPPSPLPLGLGAPEPIDGPVDGGPTPAPIPLLPPARDAGGGEDSVRDLSDDAALKRLLEERLPVPTPDDAGTPSLDLDAPPPESPAVDDPFTAAGFESAEGPRVTPLWGVED